MGAQISLGLSQVFLATHVGGKSVVKGPRVGVVSVSIIEIEKGYILHNGLYSITSLKKKYHDFTLALRP